jgi:hypothetical protein
MLGRSMQVLALTISRPYGSSEGDPFREIPGCAELLERLSPFGFRAGCRVRKRRTALSVELRSAESVGPFRATPSLCRC